MIKVERDDETVLSVEIDGEPLQSDEDGAPWTTPSALLRPYNVADLPGDVSFALCQEVQEGIIVLDQIPVTIRRAGENLVHAEFESSGTRKYWNGKVGFSHYMETMRDIVAEREKEIGDIRLHSYDDDGAYITLTFSADVMAVTCEELFAVIDQIVAEVEGATDLRVGVDAFQPQPAEDEREFTLRTVIPILRKLGFSNVRYSHGRREFGRDIVFARLTEFGELEHWGAQVKHGDVSGAAGADVDEIIRQIDDSFKMPFYDLYTRSQVRPAKMCVIISGRFTENAIEKICEKIESYAVRNNVVFIDEPKIATLSERFRRLG